MGPLRRTPHSRRPRDGGDAPARPQPPVLSKRPPETVFPSQLPCKRASGHQGGGETFLEAASSFFFSCSHRVSRPCEAPSPQGMLRVDRFSQPCRLASCFSPLAQVAAAIGNTACVRCCVERSFRTKGTGNLHASLFVCVPFLPPPLSRCTDMGVGEGGSAGSH